jgi:HTH-type transcriptional regulator/antitoxin HigA
MPKSLKKKSAKKTINYDDYVVDRFKKDPKFLKACLVSAFQSYQEDRDVDYLLDTLRQAASVKGVSQLAEETGLSRQYLYEMLSEKGNPTIKVFGLVLKAFGYRMVFKPI